MIETIVAQATPPGRGGIGILRISGPQVIPIAHTLLGCCPKPRYANYRSFYDQKGQILDQGIALFFPHPHSFTGEDVLELQAHGGPIVLDLLTQAILQHPGVRIARPGEFSERAFLNNKLDLTQAEAIADLIDASSEKAARCAISSLQGAFSQRIDYLVSALIQLRLFVESALDFPEEEIDVLSETNLVADLDQLIIDVNAVYNEACQGRILREGIKVVLAGHPNAGKSSLMNALTGHESAIVTPIAGTTRDVLREQIQIDGIALHIIDTAGLRQATDEIEKIGVARAWQEIEQADHLLLVVDSSSTTECCPYKLWPDNTQPLPKQPTITVIRNKVDLTDEPVGIVIEPGYTLLRLCARSGDGITLLRDHLKQTLGMQNDTEGLFLARRRHLKALEESAQHLQQGRAQLLNFTASELLAESLRLAQHSLSTITGQFTNDDLLGEIFSRFCIGK